MFKNYLNNFFAVVELHVAFKSEFVYLASLSQERVVVLLTEAYTVYKFLTGKHSQFFCLDFWLTYRSRDAYIQCLSANMKMIMVCRHMAV